MITALLTCAYSGPAVTFEPSADGTTSELYGADCTLRLHHPHRNSTRRHCILAVALPPQVSYIRQFFEVKRMM
jgi:hypothetical protein